MVYNVDMTKVIIADADRKNAAFVAAGFERQGFQCALAADAASFLRLLSGENFALAVMDVLLPDQPGLELIRRLRKDGNPLPVIILSALGESGDKISGLNAGADDYMSKPFDLNELIARAQAILRRTGPQTNRDRIVIRDLVIDTLQHKVYRNGRPICLTPREYALLEFLALNTGRTVTPRMIMQAIWEYDAVPLTTVVGTRLCLLRKKLCAQGEDELIHTVRGFGYVLK